MQFAYIYIKICNILPMTVTQIGEAIRKRRTSLKLTQEDLSEMSEIAIRTIHQIENGSGNPSFNTLNQLFQILGLDLSINIKEVN